MRSGSIAPFTICFPALDNAAVEFPLLVSWNLTRRSANWLAVHFLYHCGHCGFLEASYSFAAVSASSKQKQDAEVTMIQLDDVKIWDFRLIREYTPLVSVAEYDDDNDDDDDYTYKCCVRRNVTELTWSGIALRKLRRSKLASSWRYRLQSILQAGKHDRTIRAFVIIALTV